MSNSRKHADPKYGSPAPVDAVQPFLSAGNALVQGWMTLNSALVDFTQSRFRQNIELGQALASSKTIDDMAALQSDFARAAIQQYVDQTEKMLKLGAKTVTDSVAAAQQGARAPASAAEVIPPPVKT